jgi:predicted CoA-binding protein
MADLTALLHDPEVTIAVVGATDNLSKYGSIIYRDLKRKGYRVWPVNPNRALVDGDPAFPDLASLPSPPGIINMVVPPEVSRQVVEDARRLGYDHIWFQPGSSDRATLALAEEAGLGYLADACIMVVTRWRPAG